VVAAAEEEALHLATSLAVVVGKKAADHQVEIDRAVVALLEEPLGGLEEEEEEVSSH
jgi:hypothetical protein